MTLKTKRIIFNIDSIISFLSFIFMLVIIIKYEPLKTKESYVLLAISALVFITTVFLQLFYKKSLSTQIVFISVFLTCVSLQGIRVVESIINFDSFLITIQISRTAIFCKYLALFSLLGASLFSYFIKKQKIGSWIMLSIITSLTVSTVIHFNTGIVESSLIAKVIYGRAEISIAVLVSLIAIFTFIKTGFDTKNREYIFLGIACSLLCIGLILIYTSLSIVSGVFILVTFTTGLIIFLKGVHNITLWG